MIAASLVVGSTFNRKALNPLILINYKELHEANVTCGAEEGGKRSRKKNTCVDLVLCCVQGPKRETKSSNDIFATVLKIKNSFIFAC